MPSYFQIIGVIPVICLPYRHVVESHCGCHFASVYSSTLPWTDQLLGQEFSSFSELDFRLRVLAHLLNAFQLPTRVVD